MELETFCPRYPRQKALGARFLCAANPSPNIPLIHPHFCNTGGAALTHNLIVWARICASHPWVALARQWCGILKLSLSAKKSQSGRPQGTFAEGCGQ